MATCKPQSISGSREDRLIHTAWDESRQKRVTRKGARIGSVRTLYVGNGPGQRRGERLLQPCFFTLHAFYYAQLLGMYGTERRLRPASLVLGATVR